MSERIPQLRYDPERVEAYRTKLAQYIESLPHEKQVEVFAKIEQGKQELLKHYSEETLPYCAMWHALSLGTIDSRRQIFTEDLRGGDSIADFIDNLVGEG